MLLSLASSKTFNDLSLTTKKSPNSLAWPSDLTGPGPFLPCQILFKPNYSINDPWTPLDVHPILQLMSYPTQYPSSQPQLLKSHPLYIPLLLLRHLNTFLFITMQISVSWNSWSLRCPNNSHLLVFTPCVTPPMSPTGYDGRDAVWLPKLEMKDIWDFCFMLFLSLALEKAIHQAMV